VPAELGCILSAAELAVPSERSIPVFGNLQDYFVLTRERFPQGRRFQQFLAGLFIGACGCLLSCRQSLSDRVFDFLVRHWLRLCPLAIVLDA